MALPIFPPSPPAPRRGDDAATVFREKADVFAAWWASLPEQMREFAAALTAAIGVANFTSASVTSLTVGVGVMALTVDTGKMFVPGGFVMLADSAAPTTNRMYAEIVSYDFGTGAMVVNVERVWGGGSHAGWVVGLVGPQGVGGDVLPSFTGNGGKVLALNAAGTAAEWREGSRTLIATLTPSNAPNVSFTSIKAAGFNDLQLVYDFTLGAGSTAAISFSPNGSAWSTVISNGASGSHGGALTIPGARENVGVSTFMGISDPSPALLQQANNPVLRWRIAGGIDAIRVAGGGGGILLTGTVSLYGRH